MSEVTIIGSIHSARGRAISSNDAFDRARPHAERAAPFPTLRGCYAHTRSNSWSSERQPS
jgi:hypothetical protein